MVLDDQLIPIHTIVLSGRVHVGQQDPQNLTKITPTDAVAPGTTFAVTAGSNQARRRHRGRQRRSLRGRGAAALREQAGHLQHPGPRPRLLGEQLQRARGGRRLARRRHRHHRRSAPPGSPGGARWTSPASRSPGSACATRRRGGRRRPGPTARSASTPTSSSGSTTARPVARSPGPRRPIAPTWSPRRPTSASGRAATSSPPTSSCTSRRSSRRSSPTGRRSPGRSPTSRATCRSVGRPSPSTAAARRRPPPTGRTRITDVLVGYNAHRGRPTSTSSVSATGYWNETVGRHGPQGPDQHDVHGADAAAHRHRRRCGARPGDRRRRSPAPRSAIASLPVVHADDQGRFSVNGVPLGVSATRPKLQTVSATLAGYWPRNPRSR